MGLVFHKLATNAAKYGGLSTPEGRVTGTSKLDRADLEIVWTETGGKGLIGAPERQRCGTRLIDMSIVQQLNGQIERIWDSTGLTVKLVLQAKRLTRRNDTLPEQG